MTIITIVRFAFRILVVLAFCVSEASAFSLLGPFAVWMDKQKSYGPYDIGGPMLIGEGYRWNVPVITYGFDRSFISYFGSNGVAAVEGAIAMLNALPPASEINLTDYPSVVTEVNYQAQALQLYDLKSTALFLLVEHLGLAEPQRYVSTLRDRYLAAGSNCPNYTYSVIQRNFDPDTSLASAYVNGVMFSSYINDWCPDVNAADAFEFPVDPSSDVLTAVADGSVRWDAGRYYSALTRDDIGGLRYLLSTNNRKFEILLPDVHGTGTNTVSWVNGAVRAGVNKITFTPQPWNSLSGQFLPVTNYFTDTYITNNEIRQQQLERVITQPDFLFIAADLHEGNASSLNYSRSGTSNWWNGGAVMTNDGPGVIQPPVNIVFHTLGPSIQTDEGSPPAYITGTHWASFDGSTNAAIVYPDRHSWTNVDGLTVHLRFFDPPAPPAIYDWHVPISLDRRVSLETSTNL